MINTSESLGSPRWCETQTLPMSADLLSATHQSGISISTSPANQSPVLGPSGQWEASTGDRVTESRHQPPHTASGDVTSGAECCDLSITTLSHSASLSLIPEFWNRDVSRSVLNKFSLAFSLQKSESGQLESFIQTVLDIKFILYSNYFLIWISALRTNFSLIYLRVIIGTSRFFLLFFENRWLIFE